jgi:hypothetical protein
VWRGSESSYDGSGHFWIRGPGGLGGLPVILRLLLVALEFGVEEKEDQEM